MTEQDMATINALMPAFNAFFHKQSELNSIQIEQLRQSAELSKEKKDKQALDDIRIWTTDEAQHVACCDGSSVKAVREWIREIKASSKRLPSGCDEDAFMKKLIAKTSRGELFEESERYMNKFTRDLVSWGNLTNHIIEAFLGPDEQEALREELKRVKQCPREDIPAFNRRFVKAAELAYPRMDTEDESRVTLLYMVALCAGKLQDKLFDHEPRLVKLEDATAAAYNEWARLRFRERALQTARSDAAHEPMEVDSLTVRDQLANQQKEIQALKRQLETVNAESATPAHPIHIVPRDTCRYCREKGHWHKECPKNKEYWAKKGGERRPLPPDERALN